MSVSLTALQENLIVLLAYDDKHCATVRNLVPIEFWGGPYREISRRVYDYVDRYKKPPKDHIADLLGDKLTTGKTTAENTLYEDILLGIKDQSTTINADYVIQQLGAFVRRQSLRSIAIDLAKALQSDTDDSLDEAEKLIHGAKTHTANVFDKGTRLSDKQKVLDFLDEQTPCFPTGIHELDKRGFGPTRKEIWLYIAAAKRGKTWMLIQLAKMAAMHRLRVCHITLEMSESRTAQRYMQAFFALAKRPEELTFQKFKRDSLGRLSDFEDRKVKPKLSLDDPKIHDKLSRKIDRFSNRYLDNIIVKQFPTGQLTVRQLEAYLDSLENNERFVPDLLVVDYPDLMRIDKDNYRLGVDEIYKDLRGLCVSRNMAGAIVSQSNRSGEKAKNVGNDQVAEAWSKIAHADCVITYNQTKAEHDLGLARLRVTAGRNDEDKMDILISQNYAIGTFVCDSILMKGSNYWQLLPQKEGDE
jgi:replicative DNA helicase